MRKTTQNTKNRSQSKFLGQRRRFFLTKRTAKLGFNFLKMNHGTLSVSTMETGAKKATFSSKVTGRTAFAYGTDFHAAYQKLVKLFYLKYTS